MKRFLVIMIFTIGYPLFLEALVEADGTVVHVPFLLKLVLQVVVFFHAASSYDMLFPEGRVRGR
ncbi:hypothetical protein Pori4_00039 [Pseudomonas phage vB_PpuM-Pori-4]